jgi:diguanylate cyclase (GGDEF)-like protein
MLTGTYNPTLVLLSYLVAAIASYVALDMAGRINASRDPRTARGWLVGGACAMGTGIWSMHFIGMLAFRLPIPQGYDVLWTLYSLAIAIAGSAYALWLVSHQTLALRRIAVGALILGAAIATMHYVGMAAMRMQPGIVYDPLWFAASIVIAIGAAAAALWIAFALRVDGKRAQRIRVAAALVMGFAVIGMHYTGMAAAQFPAGSICGAAIDGGIPPHWLATLVGVGTFSILAMSLLVSVLDRRLEERTALLNTSLHQANEELSYLALHDNLTKLPNRLLLEDRLQHAIEKAARNGSTFALMFVDLDGFKEINDVYGHMVGDQLLLHIARNLKSVVRAEDTLARIGGDEFVLLMQVGEPSDAANAAEKMLVQVGLPLSFEHGDLNVTGSVGVAIYGDDGVDARALMANADAAMYSAKEQGRNGYCFFEPSMNRGAHEQLALVQDLRRALSARQLVLHYQPQYTTLDQSLQGVEALLRWEHPRLGLLPADRFVGLAEKSGLIAEIGRWVLDEACRQMMQWRSEGLAVPNVAVNLSATQFRSIDLADRVGEALSSHGLEPAALTLEITESTAMHDPEASLQILHKLASIGVSISIDDFGTGYSSLLYLKRLPASELKIDRAFIKDLVAGGEDEAIVSAIIALARTLEMKVIAEGVETEAQGRLLTTLGCTSLQGFHLGHPEHAHTLSLAWQGNTGRGPARGSDRDGDADGKHGGSAPLLPCPA